MVATFAAMFAALYAAHMVGDHWIQTHPQSQTKGGPGSAARLADLRHVTTLTLTKAIVLLLAWATVGLSVTVWIVPALLIDAASHYWADRRSTLLRLARAMDRIYPGFGKVQFATLGSPRPGHDDNPSIGTGLYSLDQSWHVLWLFIAALIAAH
jgi:hypothetical protein